MNTNIATPWDRAAQRMAAQLAGTALAALPSHRLRRQTLPRFVDAELCPVSCSRLLDSGPGLYLGDASVSLVSSLELRVRAELQIADRQSASDTTASHLPLDGRLGVRMARVAIKKLTTDKLRTVVNSARGAALRPNQSIPVCDDAKVTPPLSNGSAISCRPPVKLPRVLRRPAARRPRSGRPTAAADAHL